MFDMIYWEQQDGSMCAVHALNTLLQFPYWNPASLAEVARELDLAENNLSTNWNIRNYNVREDGFFSIQAIMKALQVHHLTLDYLNASVDPCSLNAFIFNSNLHWFTIRKIRGIWFNLNSMSAGPKIITEFNLQALIGSLKAEGFTVFFVRGNIPAMPSPVIKDPQQYLLTVDQIRRSAELSARIRKEEERQVEEAIRRSMQSSAGGPSNSSGGYQGYGGFAGASGYARSEARGSDLLSQQGVPSPKTGNREGQVIKWVEYDASRPELYQDKISQGAYEYSYRDGPDICHIYSVPQYSSPGSFKSGKETEFKKQGLNLNSKSTVPSTRMQHLYSCTLSEEEQLKLTLELSNEDV